MDVQNREFSWDDRELILLVGFAATSEAWHRERAVLLPLTRRPGMRFFVRSQSSPDGERLISMLAWRPTGELVSFWTEPEFRGLGHFGELFRWAIQRCQSGPLHVFTKTPAVIHLVQNEGFGKVGRRGSFLRYEKIEKEFDGCLFSD